MKKYEILNVIDEGAYGIVYKVKNHDNNQIYALKKFKDPTSTPNIQKLINREIKMLKDLRSSYVVDVKQIFKKYVIVISRSDRIYIVFQYMQHNLLNLMEKSSLKQTDIIKYTFQVLKALNFLHSKNVMHRDIKPQNILISGIKTKLCDFGFARQLPDHEQVPTQYVATRWYRAPELILGLKYGPPVDIWALGCMICEMIDGKPLLSGENQLDQLYLIQKFIGKFSEKMMNVLKSSKKFQGIKLPDIKETEDLKMKYFPKISKKLMQFIQKCLKINPEQRITASQALQLPLFQQQRKSIFRISRVHDLRHIYNQTSMKNKIQTKYEQLRNKSVVNLKKQIIKEKNFENFTSDNLKKKEFTIRSIYSQKILKNRK